MDQATRERLLERAINNVIVDATKPIQYITEWDRLIMKDEIRAHYKLYVEVFKEVFGNETNN